MEHMNGDQPIKELGRKASVKPDYGNWVSKRIIIVPGIIGLVFLALAFAECLRKERFDRRGRGAGGLPESQRLEAAIR